VDKATTARHDQTVRVERPAVRSRYTGWPPGHAERFADRAAFEREARERAAETIGFLS
jgi:hypothetical protein